MLYHIIVLLLFCIRSIHSFGLPFPLTAIYFIFRYINYFWLFLGIYIPLYSFLKSNVIFYLHYTLFLFFHNIIYSVIYSHIICGNIQVILSYIGVNFKCPNAIDIINRYENIKPIHENTILKNLYILILFSSLSSSKNSPVKSTVKLPT